MWRLSPWDWRVHAFPEDELTKKSARALCTHSALTRRLQEAAMDDSRRCHPCFLFHGDELASRHGDANRWGM